MSKTDELKRLAKTLDDSSRKTTVVGRQALVPLKFDDEGSPLSKETFNVVKHLKRLNLDELRFLKAWRDAEWDFDKACQAAMIDRSKAMRIQKKVQAFREEDAIIRAMAEIPTPSLIAAKQVENLYNGGQLNDSQRDSLKELAKITGAYKPTTNLHITANAFVMPQLPPDQADAAKKFFDTIAEDSNAA